MASRPRKAAKNPAKPPPEFAATDTATNGAAKRVPLEGEVKIKGGLLGRIASSIPVLKVEWLIQPYLPRGMLSFLVGQPESGKSTAVAWYVKAAKRSIILPGEEENVERLLIPRLLEAGNRLDDVLILDEGDWTMPRARDELIRTAKVWGADLIVADPIDSYRNDSGSEDNGPHIREFLECWAKIAEETHCAVVGVRHPGKDPTNVCPGSRCWRAVPRCIYEMVADPTEEGQGVIRKYKDSLGQQAPARTYTLQGLPGEPRVFVLGKEVGSREAQAMKEVPDRAEREVLEDCKQFLRQTLKERAMDCQELYLLADKLKLIPRTLRLAATAIGVKKTAKGFGKEYTSEWSL